MLIIDVHKDLDEYKGSAMMGLSWKQVAAFVVSAGISVGTVLILKDKIGLTLSCYLSMPIVMPIALNAFYQKNGMNFTQYISKNWKMLFQKPLLYVSEEGPKQTNSKENLETAGTGKQPGNKKRKKRKTVILKN